MMAASCCTLRGVVEAVEGEFGDAILARDDAVAALSAGLLASLGPPDLCWLQKSSRSGGGLLFGRAQPQGEAQGYYHHVLGRDVSSSAAVAAYFALLTSRVEVHSGLSLWGSSECVIQRGFYCCWDAISGVDVRIELCIPGGVAAGCVDAAGQLSDATPLAFQQAQVSAFVRAMLVDADMRLNAGPLLTYDPCPSAAAEAALLSTIISLYSSGRLPGGLQGIAEQQGFGVAAEHTDLVCAAVWQHFRRRQRWEAAAEFFRRLAAVCPCALLLLAAAERAQRVGQGAGGVLLSDRLAEVMGRSGGASSPPRPTQLLVPATLVGLGHEQLALGDSAAAAGLARRALAAAPRCRPAWLLLAAAFIAARQFAAALVTLNVMPNPPLPVSDVELLHVVAPPAPKALTHPQVCAYDGEVAAARRRMAEAASLDGSRLLAYLPGTILVAAEPLGTAAAPDVCPDRITRTVLTACYDLLQDIVTQTGWDGFLEVRSRVFLMQHEVASSPARQASTSSEVTPHPQQQQQQAGGHASELQAAQHQQLVRKLQELGLHEQEGGEQPRKQQQQQQEAFSSNGSGVQRATTAAAAEPPASEAHPPRLPSTPGTAGSQATPPASAGRQSSSVGGVTPQAYYASRLDQLSKHRHAQEQATTPTRQQQQLVAPAGEPAAAPQQEQQQQQQQPWVLLLGRKTRAHSVPKEPHRPAAGAVGVGVGPGQGLAVHDLAYATASRVAPLRSSGSVTPALWSAVYGATGASSASPRPPATTPTATTTTTADDSDDESLSTAAAGLPPIRTRPLGEAVEQQAQCSGFTSSAHSFLPSLQQQRQQQPQPLGEGLDRQGSLLRRATSIASTVGGSAISPQVSASSARLAAALAGANGAARLSRRQSLLGDTSRLQADRDGLVAGSIHNDATCGGGGGGGGGGPSSSSDIPSTPRRRLCVRWLDELIVALWHDLQAHMEWKVVDETLRATRGGSAAELVLAPSKGPGGADAQSFEPALSSADWLRRGLLAERLGQQSDARMAYRAAVKLQFNLTALLALMRLEASRGSIEHTLSCVSQVLTWQQQDAATAHTGGVAVTPLAACAWVVGELADATSADDVRRGIARLPAASQPPLSQLLDEWVSWQRHNRVSTISV